MGGVPVAPNSGEEIRAAIFVLAAISRAVGLGTSPALPLQLRVDHCCTGGAASKVKFVEPLAPKGMGPMAGGGIELVVLERAQTKTMSELVAEFWCTEAASTLSPTCMMLPS